MTDPTTLTLSIDGQTVTATEGMTWGEWISSEQNTVGATLSGDYVMVNGKNLRRIVERESVGNTPIYVEDSAAGDEEPIWDYFGLTPPAELSGQYFGSINVQSKVKASDVMFTTWVETISAPQNLYEIQGSSPITIDELFEVEGEHWVYPEADEDPDGAYSYGIEGEDRERYEADCAEYLVVPAGTHTYTVLVSYKTH